MLMPAHILATCIFLSALLTDYASALPARRRDEPPPLIDTLAVAKSPFEPVTLALSLPGARNDNLPNESGENVKVELDGNSQTTRSVLSFEQERDRTSTSVGTGDSDAESSAISTSSIESPSKPNSNQSETTEAAIQPDTMETELVSTVSTEANVDQTTATLDREELDKTTTTESRVSATTEGQSMTTAATTTESNKNSPENPQPTTDASSTTESPDTDTTTAPSAAKTESSSSETGTEKAEPVSTISPNTQESSTPQSFSEKPELSTENSIVTTVSPSQTDATTTVKEEDQPSSVATTPKVEITTPEQPATTSTSTTTPEPKVVESNEDKPTISKSEEVQKDESKNRCNHLPTYEADEVQKVFREETTYKNKTIKGKFTYINYDGRYRLVHYTRLPYGPVKIDLVEELERPESGSNETAPIKPEEIPNAVLQLRNILPNSLFGFPFLNQMSKPTTDQREHDDEKLNSHYYSTDSISTPNLLSPSVPISLLPGQRKMLPTSDSSPSADTLSNSYYENLAILQNDAQKLKQANANGDALFGVPNAHQFQYALASQAITSDAKLPGLMYTYLSHSQQQQQQQPQYQYSPVPVYTFNQPQYPVRQPLLQTSSGSNRLLKQQQQNHLETSYVAHQMHQPHSHEHYVAPFMFVRPNSHIDQIEAPKLRLKVKTSKALNVNREDNNGKSAQLRLMSTSDIKSSSSSHFRSPAHNYLTQPRHRSGKQNQELKSNVNASPVVYHVLRSPVGRLYSLPQYQQAHSMAYDHDN